MGFYNTNTIEEKRVNKLTGDIHINDTFKEETSKRGIPIYDAYNIQKRLYHEVEQGQLKGRDAVDNRLMELLEEKGKKEVSHNYIEQFAEEAPLHKGMIPARPKGFTIPPKGRDEVKSSQDDENKTEELLNKLVLQNQKIINQNKIIIEYLKQIGDKL